MGSSVSLFAPPQNKQSSKYNKAANSESNETFHFLEANNPIPTASTFKPQVKVLSRKPVIAKRGDPSSAMGQLSLNDDDDDDAAKKEKQLTPEELRAKQKRDRDEKQRRYDEARAKIFGESAPSSRGSSPGTGTVTPPRNDGRYGQQQQGGRGRGRGGSQRDGGRRQQQQQQQQPQQQTSTASPARELYDPNYSARPDSGSGFQRRDDRLQNRDEGAPIRAPKGPDGSGRGGFGFARRGGGA